MRPTKRLTKSSSRQLFGVAGGIAAYLNIDPVIIRVAFVLGVFLAIPTIPVLLAYIILALVMPEPGPADVIDVSPEPPPSGAGAGGPEGASTGSTGSTGSTAKPFVRSSTDKWLAGVCGGIGHYFNVDPVLIRALFLLALIAFGAGVILYIALAIIMPRDIDAARV